MSFSRKQPTIWSRSHLYFDNSLTNSFVSYKAVAAVVVCTDGWVCHIGPDRKCWPLTGPVRIAQAGADRLPYSQLVGHALETVTLAYILGNVWFGKTRCQSMFTIWGQILKKEHISYLKLLVFRGEGPSWDRMGQSVSKSVSKKFGNISIQVGVMDRNMGLTWD